MPRTFFRCISKRLLQKKKAERLTDDVSVVGTVLGPLDRSKSVPQEAICSPALRQPLSPAARLLGRRLVQPVQTVAG